MELQTDATRVHSRIDDGSAEHILNSAKVDAAIVQLTPLQEDPSDLEGGLLNNLADDEADITAESSPSLIEDIQIIQGFINKLQRDTLSNEDILLALIQSLQDPEHCPTGPPGLDDPILWLSLDMFLTTSNTSQQSYTNIHTALQWYDSTLELLSFNQIQQHVTELSGFMPILHHMCINSCVAFTRPFQELAACLMCWEPRYNPLKPGLKIPHQEFHTIPLGPQL